MKTQTILRAGLVTISSIFCLFSPSSLRARNFHYLEPARSFLLNPALQDSCFSTGAKFYNGESDVMNYNVSLSTKHKKFSYFADGDYLYFKYYKMLNFSGGLSYKHNIYSVGGYLSYQQDSEENIDEDCSISTGINFLGMSHYLICTSISEKQWAVETRKDKFLVFRLEEENFLVATENLLNKFSSLKISLRKNELASGIKFTIKKWFIQFSTIWHRHTQADYLVNVGREF